MDVFCSPQGAGLILSFLADWRKAGISNPFFRYDDPCDNVYEESGSEGEEGYEHPQEPDEGRVDSEVLTNAAADTAEHSLRL